ncbi:hypothetical protein MMC20_003214 [Loxospora ochrophaea]|nr:hypothetical protein [Loxospora ochrophaea]
MRAEWHSSDASLRDNHFIFSTEDIPLTGLVISSSSTAAPAPIQSPKRTRARADVDGEGSEDAENKKRRLRRDLVTSRLSRPYATPTTHIVSHATPKRLIGPQRRPPARYLLRKAAIMNRIRRKNAEAKAVGAKQVEISRKPPSHQLPHETSLHLTTAGAHCAKEEGLPHNHDPPIPSPLGPSNYDALDEEDPFDEEDEEEDTDTSSVYSSLNLLGLTDSSYDDDLDSSDDTAIQMKVQKGYNEKNYDGSRKAHRREYTQY